MNSGLSDLFSQYVDATNDPNSAASHIYSDMANDYMSMLPLARQVFSKTIASDLVEVETADAMNNKKIVSVELAEVLWECNYRKQCDYYYDNKKNSHELIKTPYRNLYSTSYDKGIEKIAAPYFIDVLNWLSESDNYSKYSKAVFNVPNKFYTTDKGRGGMSEPLGQLFYMDFKY